MLVYANSFEIDGNQGCESVTQQIAHWVGSPRKTFVDAVRLAEGIRELRFADGAVLSSLATIDHEKKKKFPYRFNARLTHGQYGVPGRLWIAEIGLKQDAPDSNIQCSVTLRTDEISAKVNVPIQVTRPKIVEMLVSNCKPTQNLPSLREITLTEENARAFLYEIEHVERRYPIVEISADRNGIYPVSPERLRSMLLGLAKVINIPPSVDTYRLEEMIGRKYVSFNGAINIISPCRQINDGIFCKNIVLTHDEIEQIIEVGTSVESEILSLVTHQTNLPNSWKHTSRENVRETILRIKLEEAALSAKNSEEASIYEELLRESSENINSKNQELDSARNEIERINVEIDQLSSENESLKHSLNSVENRHKHSDTNSTLSEFEINSIKSVIYGKISLNDSINIVKILYPNRLVFLDSAYSSAEHSDSAGFQHGSKALDLLMKLAGGYWECLSEGNGDQMAKNIFGKNDFASKESEKLSSEGKNRRTFPYNGKNIFMEKHLKHGTKDSYAETLRIHFEWDAVKKKIIIGHCGKHLNF